MVTAKVVVSDSCFKASYGRVRGWQIGEWLIIDLPENDLDLWDNVLKQQ